jgi:hypothetical protein
MAVIEWVDYEKPSETAPPPKPKSKAKSAKPKSKPKDESSVAPKEKRAKAG